MTFRFLSTLAFALLVFNSFTFSAGFADESRISFNQSIRPILSDKCFVCHGPDAGSRQAELRLDTPEGAYAALSSSDAEHAIVPGEALKSAVYLRLVTDESSEKMPPPDSNLSLTAEEIETLRRWIDEGATYQAHWSLLSPQRHPLPADADSSWSSHWVDAFVSSKLHQHQLKANPSATKEQLIRRATFDLTGLPPNLSEIDEFLADQSENAFEKVIDRLLASPRYGERMASEWLDVARYSDTYGFQVDRERFVWPWRDWVIRAFNHNLPYDEFIVQQLAGDMLPDATREQILATTFCRLHPQETEGGSVPEEYRVEYIADRIQTVATAFMGLTLECCRCHDHKYDPISQKEYFQLFAYFDDIDEAGLYSYFTDAVPTPTLQIAHDSTLNQQQAAYEQVASLETKLDQIISDFARLDVDRLNSALPEVTDSSRFEIPGLLAHIDFENVDAPNQLTDGIAGKAALLTGDDPIKTAVGNFHRYDPFTVSVWVNVPDHKERAVILHRSAAWTDAGSRGYELLLEDGKLSVALVHFDPGNSLRIRTSDSMALKEWKHIAFSYDGSSRSNGLKLYIDGQPVDVDVVRDQLTRDITGGGGDTITIGERMRDSGFKAGSVDEFRLYDRALYASEIQFLFLHPACNGESLPSGVEQALLDRIRTERSLDLHPDYQVALKELKDAREQASKITESIPEIMVMREMSHPKQAYILARGEYQNRSEEVFAKTPESLSTSARDFADNRLGFAEWLTEKGHPRTSRSTVNRYWQMLFGNGIVRTPEDFGLQGQWPTHPELLDTLAVSFEEHDWDVKWLLKEIMLSATYQQSTQMTAEQFEHDPSNLWISRMNSSRLPAEMLRDQALSISGLLVEKIGGAPVKPYELAIAFKPLPIDSGEGLYRRSLYTFWTRTGPAPAMMTLDAAKRDVCQVRRDQTLSPLQPLVMLNGPQFIEAARQLAERVKKQHGAHSDIDQSALIDLFRWTTSRMPTEEEKQSLTRLYEGLKASFKAHPTEASEYLNIGESKPDSSLDQIELAALAAVATTLLNTNDCVFKR